MSKQQVWRCDGVRLRRGLADAAAWLEARAAEINALNVFPVPDGDTGTNMSLTFRSAEREASTVAERAIGVVARAAAHGALLGARGNSGVILSQFFRGIARYLERHVDCGPAELAGALVAGSATADKAVIRPVEGTILTVGRDAAQGALAAAEAGADLATTLEAAVAAARASVARTPSLLPVLREAGVVDAGGQGLLYILEGLLGSLGGESVAPARAGRPASAPRLTETAEYGYCTEFLLRGADLDLAAIRETVAGLGDSALVVGEGNLARVHIHTFRPGQVLEYAVRLGTLHHVKIDNMQDQHAHVLAGAGTEDAGRAAGPAAQQQAPVDATQPAMVAVAAGLGFANVYRSLGVGGIVPGGQTMNPSTEEILRAVEGVPSRRVLLLPNNANILLAAKQVLLLTEKEVVVVPTRDLAQGVAAALAYQPEADLATNAAAMERALRAVRTGEVTAAVRPAKLDGLEVRAGELIGLVGGQLAAVGADEASVVRQLLGGMDAEHAEILTLYYGAEADASRAAALATAVRASYPHLQVEVVGGGQPHYHFIFSLE